MSDMDWQPADEEYRTDMPIIRPGRWPSAAYKAGYEQAVLDAVEAVKALRDENRQGTDPEWGVLNGVVAVIEVLGGER